MKYIWLLLLIPSIAFSQALDRRRINMYDPAVNGATCDSTVLNAAISSIGTDPTILLVPKTDRSNVLCSWVLTDNVTTDVNTRLSVPHGVQIDHTGFTLTINGPFEAGVNTFTSNASVVFGPGSVECVDPIWWGKTKDDVTLQTALTAIGSTEISLCPSVGTWNLSANITIPSTLTLDLRRGVELCPASTFTLTINGELDVGNGKVFCTDGSVTGLTYVKPEWFGADATDVVDDSVAMRAALATLPLTGGYFELSQGAYIVSPESVSKIALPITQQNIKVVGKGMDLTTVRLANAVGEHVGTFVASTDVTDISGFEISHLTIDYNVVGNDDYTSAADFQGTIGNLVRARAGVYWKVGNDIVITNVRFIDQPRQGVRGPATDQSATDVQKVTVSFNHFLTTSGNPGTLDIENTALFIAGGRKVNFMNNRFENLSHTNYTRSRTGIQISASDSIASGNVFDGYYRCILAGGQVGERVRGLTVEGNICSNSNRGIEILIFDHPEFSTDPGIVGVTVLNNIINTNFPAYARPIPDAQDPFGISLLQLAEMSIEDLLIIANMIRFVPGAITTGEAGISVVYDSAAIASGVSRNIQVNSNTIINAPGPGIRIGLRPSGERVSVCDNIIVDPVQRTGQTGGRVQFISFVTDNKRTKVCDNQMTDTRTPNAINEGIRLGGLHTNASVFDNDMHLEDGGTEPLLTIVDPLSTVDVDQEFFETFPDVTSANILADSCGDYAVLTVNGAAFGDKVDADPTEVVANGIEDFNLSWNSFVSAANTVTIRACNPNGLAANPSDLQDWEVHVIQRFQ